MSTPSPFEIFLVTAPGLEQPLCEEAAEAGFTGGRAVNGGVIVEGGWPEVWRANLCLRGAARVLARIGAFRAPHLAQLDKRARKLDWSAFLRPGIPVRVEASCKRSRIYHAGAAAQRIENAIGEEFGAPIAKDAELVIKVRIENDLCTISIDTTGEALHKRGHKQAVNKAPMRENLAAMFLRQCGYTGDEPVLDPMCGSGTFVIEAAEIALGLLPGRNRTFAFEHLASFDPAAFAALKAVESMPAPSFRFCGSDRDAGAIEMSKANAKRAGVDTIANFLQRKARDITRPDGPPGLVVVNPPYGLRIGDKRQLSALYAGLGQALLARFSGWRVGLITADPALAKATRLPFAAPAPSVDNAGTRIALYRTDTLS